jgi:hypothetical protein
MKYFLMNEEYTKTYNIILRNEKAKVKEWVGYAKTIEAETVALEVHGGTLMVIGYMFEKDPDPKQFYQPGQYGSVWQPYASTKLAKVMQSQRTNSRQQFYDLIGWPQHVFAYPAMLHKGKHRVVLVPTHGYLLGHKIKAKPFTPLGCKRITDVEYENLGRNKIIKAM